MTAALAETFKPTIGQRLAAISSLGIQAVYKPTIPRFQLYGGATITGAHDAVGKEYTVCCAKDLSTNKFGLYAFQDDMCVLFAPVSGRGSVEVSLFDGRAYWRGWESTSKYMGEIPGFVPFISLVEVALRLTQIETALGNVGDGPLPKPPTQPIPITSDSALGQLYSGNPPYNETHFDTPAETAARVQKQLMALHQLVDILWKQGLVVKV